MSASILLPLLLGLGGILQGALNRQIVSGLGLAHTVFITNFGTLVICIIFYYLALKFPQLFPDYIQLKVPLSTYKWWYIFPPFLGFFIVAGIPIAILNLGAVKVTVGLIVAQMITSIFWDYFVEDIKLNLLKIIGIFFAFLSVALITLAKK